jgi:hypothetical protein
MITRREDRGKKIEREREKKKKKKYMYIREVGK